jgi:hypothetical protein
VEPEERVRLIPVGHGITRVLLQIEGPDFTISRSCSDTNAAEAGEHDLAMIGRFSTAIVRLFTAATITVPTNHSLIMLLTG